MSVAYCIKFLGATTQPNKTFVMQPNGKYDGYVSDGKKIWRVIDINKAHQEAEERFHMSQQVIVEECS